MDIGVGKIGIADSLDDAFPSDGLDAALVAEPMNREVLLDKEIAGISSFAAHVAGKTNRLSYPLLCGCITRLGSVRHMSVMTFSRGRLADIADRTLSLCGGGFTDGDTIKVLRLKRFDMGLLVDTDILLAKNWKRITPQCAAVVCIGKSAGEEDFTYIPTLSSLFGKPYAAVFAGGEILWGDPTKA